MEEGDETRDPFHRDLDDGVGQVDSGLGSGIGVVVDLHCDHPAVEQVGVLDRKAIDRRGGQRARRGRGPRVVVRSCWSWSWCVVGLAVTVVVVSAAPVQAATKNARTTRERRMNGDATAVWESGRIRRPNPACQTRSSPPRTGRWGIAEVADRPRPPARSRLRPN